MTFSNRHLKKNNFILLLFLILLGGCDKDQFDENKGTFTDKRDGQEYKWVKIGAQIWMAENLAYIPNICGPDSDCGIYVYNYGGEGSFGTVYSVYGVLYNWETAMNVCPEGWHLPSDEEWMELELFLGMEFDELDHPNGSGTVANIGGKLKDAESGLWEEPNEGATNETGFSALPAGYLNASNKRFSGLNSTAVFWTASENELHRAMNRMYSRHANGRVRSSRSKLYGYSVRCIKD